MAQDDTLAVSPKAAPAEWTASRPLKILVAEDTDVLRMIIRRVLVNLKHYVVMAENGMIAVEQFAAEDFDLILMDALMPVMDGLEATAAIRGSDGEKSNIPIIALTADTTAEMAEALEKAGINSLCPKPVELARLLPVINEALGEEIHTQQ